MDIITAIPSDLKTVQKITHDTIKAVYPHYYPAGAVAFFLAHHSAESILRDIESGCVFLALESGEYVGTVTVSGDEINRLFVLPEHQGNGCGGALLRFAENKIAKSFGTARLDSSLPAKTLYARKGYMVISPDKIETENGDFLCFDTMIKRVTRNAD